MNSLAVKTPNTTAEVTTADAREWLQHDAAFTDDDSIIDDMVKAAAAIAEATMSNPILRTTYYWYLDRFPRGRRLRLPRDPVVALPAPVVSYVPAGDTAHDYTAGLLDAADYHIVEDVIHLDDGVAWPDIQRTDQWPVRIEFAAGFGTLASDIPDDLAAALKIIICQLYQQRSGLSDKPANSTPYAARVLLAPYMRHFPQLGNAI